MLDQQHRVLQTAAGPCVPLPTPIPSPEDHPEVAGLSLRPSVRPVHVNANAELVQAD
jgi:hypothetical protein